MRDGITIKHITASQTENILEVRKLFEEYAHSLDVDLCFQNFEIELGGLPGDYQEPNGILLLAFYEGKPAGCCALRPLKNATLLNTAEMKRLYVRPEFRGRSIAHELVNAILEFAKDKGYAAVALDTLQTMTEARALYKLLGFREIEPYYENPYEGTTYMKLEFSSVSLPHQ